MPQYLKFPLKGRENWPQFNKRLSPNSPARISYYRESMKRQHEHRDFPLGVSAGSMFGCLRDWMGLENIAVTMYDDPEIMHEMMDHLADLFVAVLERSVSDFRFDHAFMWEDMAYKTASMISPSHFQEFLIPRYKRVVEVLLGSGIDKIVLASDKRAIEDMVASKRDLISERGYIPGVDHAIPPDIPWDNFLYYRRLVNEV